MGRVFLVRSVEVSSFWKLRGCFIFLIRRGKWTSFLGISLYKLELIAEFCIKTGYIAIKGYIFSSVSIKIGFFNKLVYGESIDNSSLITSSNMFSYLTPPSSAVLETTCRLSDFSTFTLLSWMRLSCSSVTLSCELYSMVVGTRWLSFMVVGTLIETPLTLSLNCFFLVLLKSWKVLFWLKLLLDWTCNWRTSSNSNWLAAALLFMGLSLARIQLSAMLPSP